MKTCFVKSVLALGVTMTTALCGGMAKAQMPNWTIESIVVAGSITTT